MLPLVPRDSQTIQCTHLTLGDERPSTTLGIEAIANLERLCLLHEELDEFVVDRVLHIHT
jgi:hypothetical protein